MSLDFSLREPCLNEPENWDDFYEDDYKDNYFNEVFTRNITHNCSKMMRAAHQNLYKALYESHDQEAISIIPQLSEGLLMLAQYQEDIKKLEPANGWGSYEGLVNFVCDVLGACVKHPNATIHVCA